MDTHQYGFMKHSSTTAATTDFIEDLLRCVDEEKITLAAYVDLSGAMRRRPKLRGALWCSRDERSDGTMLGAFSAHPVVYEPSIVTSQKCSPTRDAVCAHGWLRRLLRTQGHEPRRASARTWGIPALV